MDSSGSAGQAAGENRNWGQMIVRPTADKSEPLQLLACRAGEYHGKNEFKRAAVRARRTRSRAAAYSSSAVRSAAATEPCVGSTHAVGQRVTPLVRMNSLTAASPPRSETFCSLPIIEPAHMSNPAPESVLADSYLTARSAAAYDGGHTGFPLELSAARFTVAEDAEEGDLAPANAA